MNQFCLLFLVSCKSDLPFQPDKHLLMGLATRKLFCYSNSRIWCAGASNQDLVGHSKDFLHFSRCPSADLIAGTERGTLRLHVIPFLVRIFLSFPTCPGLESTSELWSEDPSNYFKEWTSIRCLFWLNLKSCYFTIWISTVSVQTC